MMERSRSRKDVIEQLQYDTRTLEERFDHKPGFSTFDDWHIVGNAGEPAFQQGWVNFGGTNQETCAFWKDSSGIVRLRGIVKNGSIPAQIFTLPAGYRPPGFKRFAVVSAGAFGYVAIESDGDVAVQAGTNTYVDLSPCSFRAEG